MGLKDILKQKLDAIDKKVKDRLEVHAMDPKLKKMHEVRTDFRKVGDNIDENIDMIERMKSKVDNMEKENEAAEEEKGNKDKTDNGAPE